MPSIPPPVAALVLLLAQAIPAAAQSPAPGLAEQAARRHPQPVRVADLLGRDVLKPIEAQPILGHVQSVLHRPGGGVDFVVRQGGFLGFGGTDVTVPAEALALLGEHLALLGLPPDRLATLPPPNPAATPIPASETVSLSLTKPFH